MDCMPCGRFITTLRKEKGWTQKDLADRLHVTDKAISRWETGKGLPDAESMLALSDLFEVTVNELLRGERTPPAHTADSTLRDVLFLVDDEKKKQRRWRTALIVVCIFVLLLAVLHDVTSGGGYTLSSVAATVQLHRVTDYIENGQYKKAAALIGFAGHNRITAQKEWVDGMKETFTDTLEIVSFTVSPLEEEDQFIYGTTQLRIYDKQTQERYVFDVSVAIQDGIAFGAVRPAADASSDGESVATVIEHALSTYYAG